MEAPTKFDTDTAAEPLGDGRYRVRFDTAWWVAAGPNGGYVAATLVNALRAELGDDARALRSLTVHYASAPKEGEGEIVVRAERSGRNLTTLSARVEQDGKLRALALAAFAGEYPSAAAFEHAVAPQVEGPEEIEILERGFEPPPFARNFDFRPALGSLPFSGGDVAHTGGWIRLGQERPLDEPLLAAICDAWWPAPFSVVGRVAAAPTIDLTIHLHLGAVRPYDWVLVDMRADTLREGFFAEDARVFSRDGELIAEARQLALLLPLGDGS